MYTCKSCITFYLVFSKQLLTFHIISGFAECIDTITNTLAFIRYVTFIYEEYWRVVLREDKDLGSLCLIKMLISRLQSAKGFVVATI